MSTDHSQNLIATPIVSSSSTPTPSQDTISQLLVHNPSQLEVILPISNSPSTFVSDNTSHEKSSHPMITRLKSGAIDKKSYTEFIASFPELHYLLLDDEFKLSRGFFFSRCNQ